MRIQALLFVLAAVARGQETGTVEFHPVTTCYDYGLAQAVGVGLLAMLVVLLWRFVMSLLEHYADRIPWRRLALWWPVTTALLILTVASLTFVRATSTLGEFLAILLVPLAILNFPGTLLGIILVIAIHPVPEWGFLAIWLPSETLGAYACVHLLEFRATSRRLTTLHLSD